MIVVASFQLSGFIIYLIFSLRRFLFPSSKVYDIKKLDNVLALSYCSFNRCDDRPGFPSAVLILSNHKALVCRTCFLLSEWRAILLFAM